MKQAELRIRRWWPAAAGTVLAGVVVLSLGPDVNPRSELLDRLSHVAAYTALTALVLLARDRRGVARRYSTMALGLALVILGGVMELLQSAVHRDATVVDWLADTLGITIAVGAYSLLRAVQGRRHRSSWAPPARSGAGNLSHPRRPRS
jgi:VanZ family protein